MLVLAGPPGAGKSTVARLVAARFERSACIESDWFFTTIANGFVAPWELAAHDQNRTLLRAAEAIVLVAMVFVVLMSSIAMAFSTQNADAYSESLDRIDALYFTVTTLATVGFGDITPTASSTRVFTTVQIVLGVVLLGVGLRSLVVMAQKVKDERTSRTD